MATDSTRIDQTINSRSVGIPCRKC